MVSYYEKDRRIAPCLCWRLCVYLVSKAEKYHPMLDHVLQLSDIISKGEKYYCRGFFGIN